MKASSFSSSLSRVLVFAERHFNLKNLSHKNLRFRGFYDIGNLNYKPDMFSGGDCIVRGGAGESRVAAVS